MKKFFCKKRVWVYIILVGLVLVLNVVAWNSTAFCDFYIKNIFPIWVNTYGRVTGIIPVSIGEYMLVAGVVCVGLFPVALLMCLFGRIRRYAVGYLRFFAWVLVSVCLVMTLNCTILYHASTFSEQYLPREIAEREYTLEQLIAVRNHVVDRCNAYSQVMERDENGDILYDGDMKAEAIKAMQNLGKTYEQLEGYYPRPKPLAASDFFSQQYMTGYYFPFSMEANYNDVMYIMNFPATMCHELAHLRGYIFEDEANFIGFLACISSEDVVFQYAGYLSVLNYLDNDFYKAIGRDTEKYLAQERILTQVSVDNVYVTQDEWDRINAKAVIDTETVDEVSDTFTDTTLKVNGVADGMLSYNRVVRLLLQWYDSQGFFEE
ncbi:MAG: DUF3810 domain-containing protein [Lachnospiraceae bacterium]|nr:DUF3810 domain-containing protein [Lachnospiraceae bacterium]